MSSVKQQRQQSNGAKAIPQVVAQSLNDVLSLEWLYPESKSDAFGSQTRKVAKQSDQQFAKQERANQERQFILIGSGTLVTATSPKKRAKQAREILQKKVSPQVQQKRSRNLDQLKSVTNQAISLEGLFPDSNNGSSSQTRKVAKKEDQLKAKQRLLAIQKAKQRQRVSTNKSVDTSLSRNVARQQSAQKSDNLRQQQRRLQENRQQLNWEINLNGVTQMYPDALASLQRRDLKHQTRIVDAYAAVLKSFFNSSAELSNRSENSKCSVSSAAFSRKIQRRQVSQSRQQVSSLSSFNNGSKSVVVSGTSASLSSNARGIQNSARLSSENFSLVSNYSASSKSNLSGWNSNGSLIRDDQIGDSGFTYTGSGNFQRVSTGLNKNHNSYNGQNNSLIRADQLRSLGLSPKGKQSPLNLLWLLVLSTRILRSSSQQIINVHGISKEEIRFIQRHCANDSMLSWRNIYGSAVDGSNALCRCIAVENDITSRVRFVDVLKEAIGWRKHVIDTG